MFLILYCVCLSSLLRVSGRHPYKIFHFFNCIVFSTSREIFGLISNWALVVDYFFVQVCQLAVARLTNQHPLELGFRFYSLSRGERGSQYVKELVSNLWTYSVCCHGLLTTIGECLFAREAIHVMFAAQRTLIVWLCKIVTKKWEVLVTNSSQKTDYFTNNKKGIHHCWWMPWILNMYFLEKPCSLVIWREFVTHLLCNLLYWNIIL